MPAHGIAFVALVLTCLSACVGHHHGRELAAIDWRLEFRSFSHSDGRFEHTVLVRGEGPPVLLLHELPGLTNDALDLAIRLSDDGFKVYLPVLFGTPGERAPVRNFLRSCGGREFRCYDGDSSGRIVEWIRDLSRAIHESEPGRPMAAIGMCLTGSIPLELVADPWVVAPVLSQPALPLNGKSELATSALALECTNARGVKVLVFRFSEDKLSPPERLHALEAALPGLVEEDVIDSRPSNPYGISQKAHAVLSSEYSPIKGHPTQQAYDKLLAYLRQRSMDAVPESVPPACRAGWRGGVKPSRLLSPSGVPGGRAGSTTP